MRWRCGWDLRDREVGEGRGRLGRVELDIRG